MTTAAATEDAGRARYTYRLRVTSAARGLLSGEWARCRWVWNECVARSKKAHRDEETCGPAALDRMLTEARARTSWLREGSSIAQQQLIRDFGKSRAKALKDIRDRVPAYRRAGMPRYKKKREARPSLNYTRRSFRINDGRLHLAGGIVLRVVWSRDLPADPSSVRVYQDSIGHWYASFVVRAPSEPLPATGRAIGIDWGVKETATTTSDAHDLPNAEHGKKAAARLARYQRMMARRKPPRRQAASKGYREAKRLTAKLYKRSARRRQDDARKWAKRVVRDHDVVAVEDFRPKFLAKTTMARKAADAAIGAAKAALIEMGRKHGRTVHLINPAHSTMDCAQCGTRTKHALPLSQRTYACTACGAVSPRDKNSARVMLVRAGLAPAGVEGVRPAEAQSQRAVRARNPQVGEQSRLPHGIPAQGDRPMTSTAGTNQPARTAAAAATPRPKIDDHSDTILRLVAEGRTDKEIGEAIGYSTDTTKGQVGTLCRRYGARNRTNLVYQAIRHGDLVVEPLPHEDSP